MIQLQIHRQIEKFLKQKPESASIDEAKKLVSYNFDARNYFFARADERWLGWLWENGLLDTLKQGKKDTSRYSYNTPEIRYLVRMAKSKDKGTIKRVIDIITDKSLATSENNFNPELVDQILRILADWPAEYIIEILDKLNEDKVRTWIKRMAPFGVVITFSLERIMKKLVEAKEYEWAINFADFILTVKNKKDFKVEEIKIEKGITLPKGEITPFYISDLDHTGVFESLQKIIETGDVKWTEEIFKLLSKKFKEILDVAKPIKNKNAFVKYDDTQLMPMYSIYLFELEKPSKTDFDYKTKSFFYTLKIVWDKLVKHYKEKNSERLREIFERNIGYFNDKKAPIKRHTRSSWVFRLYALSQAPEIFKKKLKDMVFYPLKKENEQYLYGIINLSEYIKALQILFPFLTEEERKNYLETVRERFLTDISQRPEKKKDLREIYGWFFCFLQHFPTFKKFRKKLKKDGFVIPKKCSLGPEVGPIITFWQEEPRQPTNIEQYIKEPIEDFTKRLKTDWKLEKLAELDSLFKPANIEGIIKKRVEERFEEMLKAVPQFFDRENIHPHYLYAYLQGILNDLSKNREADFSPLFELFKKIQSANKKKSFYQQDQEFEKKEKIYWIANWRSVHQAIAEILKEMLKAKDGKPMVDFKRYKSYIFETLKYLLLDGYPDPTLEDDSSESKKFKFDNRKSNPFMIAINSVRGKAFESLVLYVFWDKKRALSNEVKKLMKKLVSKENTRAMTFMYAYHTPTFHYRDRNWFVKTIMPLLFGKKNKDLRLAAEEGYLSQNLYREIFQDKAFRELYKEWIKNTDVDYSNNQEHFKHPDDALADHLALGYIYDLNFDIKTDIFRLFWNTPNQRRWKEFIRFIGTVLQNQKNRLDSKEKIKKRLLKLWKFILEEKEIEDPEVLSAFGEWVDEKIDIFTDKELVEMVFKILQKSKGAWENEHSLVEKLPDFSRVDLRKTLYIIRNFFIVEYDKEEKRRRSWLVEYRDYREKIKMIFEKAIKNKTLKIEAEKIISDLIENLGEPFWFLEELVL